MKVLVLSAGLGERLKPLTDFLPKPAVSLLNIPIFFWATHFFNQSNKYSLIANTFHLPDKLKKNLAKDHLHIEFTHDGDRLLGTGGGIKNAQKKLEGSGPFWVCNGDTVLMSQSQFMSDVEKSHLYDKPIATLVVMEHPGVGKQFGGVWVDSRGKVLDLGKNRPHAADKGYHFTGYRILSEDIFKYLKNEPSDLFDALRAAMKDHHVVKIYKIDACEFFETGNKQDYLYTTRSLLNYMKYNKYESYFRQIKEFYRDSSTLNDLETQLKLSVDSSLDCLYLGNNVQIFEGTTMEGFVVLGNDVILKENCHLKNVVVLDNTTVTSGTNCENDILY